MTELDEVQLARSPEPVEPPQRPSRGPLFAVIGGLVAALALAAYLVFFDRPEPPEPAPATPKPTPELIEAPPVASTEDELFADVELPLLDASDGLARELIGQLAGAALPEGWLGGEEVLRRLTAAVDNIAEGVNPRLHLGNLAPSGAFRVTEREGLPYIDPDSYRRWDLHGQLFDSLDAERCADLYRLLEPLLQESYRDLGYPDRDFTETAMEAIRHLLRTPVPQGDLALTPRVITYAFIDEELEGLSDAQRQLLRTGPRNMRRIQGKLRAVAVALGADPASLPAQRTFRPAPVPPAASSPVQ